MFDAEVDNLQNNIYGELPGFGYCSFSVITDNPQQKLEKIVDVIRCIALYDEEVWPGDEKWVEVLPAWFLHSVKSRDEAAIRGDPGLWEFGSWLDAMKFRGWYWYSSLVWQNGFKIIVVPYNFPFIVDPLRFLIFEAGVSNSDLKYIDNSV